MHITILNQIAPPLTPREHTKLEINKRITQLVHDLEGNLPGGCLSVIQLINEEVHDRLARERGPIYK